MAHFALVNPNFIVETVLVGRDEDDGLEAQLSERTGKMYKQTSFNTRGGVHYDPDTGLPSQDQSKALRKNYAGIGYLYDPHRDAFIPPSPFPSWVLDEFSCLWEPPTPLPQDGNNYRWDEVSTSWVVVDDTSD
jgi:hypothetical protein